MKIVCVNNIELAKDSYGQTRHKRLPLTIGKIYDTVFEGEVRVTNVKFYMIEKDNNGESNHYAANYFVTLDVWREMQLNKLL